MHFALRKLLVGSLSLAAAIAFASGAHADPIKCQRSILKESGKFAQARMKALQKCEDNKVKGKLPNATVCTTEPKTFASLTKASSKFATAIDKSCGGADQDCTSPGDNDSIASLSWPGVCPGFEGQCTNTITTCDDITQCLICINSAAIAQAIDLYYGSNPSSPAVSKCESAIGKATAAFFAAKTKALGKCWDARYNGKHSASCVPTAAGDGKYLAAIQKAEDKKQAAIHKACDSMSVGALDFPSHCPNVTVPDSTLQACGGPISSIQDMIDCVDCVTEFKVDCSVPAAVPTFVPYPASQCVPVPVTPTATATSTATPTPTRTPTATLTPTVTATRTATPTTTRTATPTTTPTVTLTATATLTAGITVTPTPTRTATPTKTTTPTPTVTSTPPACGNGVIDPGEDCDPAGGPATSCQGASNTSAAFTCNAVTCQCACPTKVTFAGDPNDPASLLDTGWTGISHRSPIISNGEVTVGLSACAGSSRPCGTCTVTGPVANPQAGAGQIDNRRCTNDPSRRCTNNTPCTPRNCLGGSNQGATCTTDTQCPGGTCPASGTCQFFFGSNLPLAAGGVSTCVSNVFNGPITGTANVESGAAVNTALLSSSVFLAASVDQPCARCIGDTTINDGVLGGTCDTGPRAGLTCDGNGTVPSRPDFGTTSLDCPSPASSQIATLGINLSNATNTVTRTLTTNSPGCSGSAGSKCMCGTCNNGNNTACFTNADCPDPPGPIGPICNGKRCLGGANVGAACTAPSECPSSSCAVPGEPTKPASCQDDTTNTILDCDDAADGTPGDQEGACTVGPVDTNCTVASGHGQRGCTSDADCGGGINSCGSSNRKCFLTGGGTFTTPPIKLFGTDTLIAVGMADVPMNDVALPTLASVFCVAPTGSASVNNVAGLPGPGRVTIRGTATGVP